MNYRNTTTSLVIISLLIWSCSKKQATVQESVPKPTPVTDSVEVKKTSQILGIDVSHFQGDVNWPKVKDAKITFVYDKASEGKSFKDPDYAENKIGAHQNGIAHGSYHFFTSDADAIEQANLFISIIDYGPGDMPPVLDLEQGGIKGEINPTTFQSEVLKWLNHVESKLGVKPIIYTNHVFGDRYLTHEDFSNYHLWIAEYGVQQPTIPKTWSDRGWLIWQRSERGTIEGAIGQVDHDLYNPTKPFEVIKK
ncbi:glycoside hydrolase family 25 protein [Algoriphagus halophilus]|uniref:glycoside hydrolase family 25 protein n=1 Tax=Algoriphagus halophilus TaxID=226505 RepID=UPI00358E1004